MRAGPLVIPALAIATVALLRGPAPAAQGAAVNLTGTWKGTGHDRFLRHNAADGMKVTWTLTQTGSTISGTVVTDALVPGDGSCSSCHRAKRGTISGTVSGTSLALTMDFPGHIDEITPNCAVTFSGTASGISGNTLTALYSGGDSCENLPGQTIAFDNGTLTVQRVFTDDPLVAGSSVVRAMHIAELRARIDTVRARFGLGAYPYIDGTLSSGITFVKSAHVADLRAALAEAYVAAQRVPPIYTDPGLTPGVVVKLAHLVELRNAVVAIEGP